jgi:polyphosphate glucokinase
VNILVIDVGGSSIKLIVTGQSQPRKISSGPAFTAEQLVADVKGATSDWKYDVISMGYPGPVVNNRPLRDPWNLGPGWVGFDYQGAFGRPIRIVNDAAMQALGSYRGGKMLFLGLGTGLGSCMIVDGIVEPMELGHLPYKDSTFEDYIATRGFVRLGVEKWRESVKDVVARLATALEPDDIVLGGGNVNNLPLLPPGCRAGDNANAFLGGFRLWEKTTAVGAVRLPN